MGTLELSRSTTVNSDEGYLSDAKLVYAQPREEKGLILSVSSQKGSMEFVEAIVSLSCDDRAGVLEEGSEGLKGSISSVEEVPCLEWPCNSSDWVLRKVEEIRDVVGISCHGFEEHFRALLIAIEAGQPALAKSAAKKERELKRLECSITYKSKDESVWREKDLPLVGGEYSWSNGRSSSRLDRFLVSSSWEAHFSGLTQKVLPRLCSNHFPIMLDCGGIVSRRSYFKFENMWLKVEGFGEKVRGWWNSYNVSGTPSFVLARKLKLLKIDLMRWNKEEFGLLDTKRKRLMEELQSLEEKEVQGLLSEEDKIRKFGVVSDLENLALMEEISWRYNAIEVLCDGDMLITDEEDVKAHIVNFFEQLFSEKFSWRPKLDSLAFDSIEQLDAEWLEREFEEEEILDVVKGMDKDKAPGPDGFTLTFFQECWDVVRDDILKVFAEFHSFMKFEKSLNTTFIALIPKKAGAVEIRDFRPISLVNGIYKIISKVLANRLSRVMERIISPSQNAFVKGRQILDSVLIASECLESRLKVEKAGILIKLDMEKAYDHISWDFLDYLLRRFGCGVKWCSWIKMIEKAVEGNFLSSFVVGNKIRNSLKISHLLFADDTLIFSEPDSDNIRALRALLLISSMSLRYLGLPLGASFKAVNIWDGVIEKIEKRIARDHNATIYDSYCNSNNKVEWNIIFTRDVNDWEVDEVKALLVKLYSSKLVLKREDSMEWIPAGNAKFSYLDLPLRAPHKSKVIWDGVIEKFENGLWNVSFIRAVQDWEVGDISDFFSTLYALNLECGVEDKLLCIHPRNKNFLVRSQYNALSTHFSTLFPRRSIWKCKVPLKVAFFGWLASHGKLLTMDKLRKRGFFYNRLVLDVQKAWRIDGPSTSPLRCGEFSMG
ncbi:uncharacterized protein LOC121236643 [Juglans microcarpa x Juglans regia]|uniref:uncharacterized protein LOC121236643 n=1 Tax=Juglans microcarpa x Juglans regia TaxID=2249226 RepID=UPI001B7E78E2|nr:uncharacterized protein LOC121236643 [Juglans microcarpa x Juglans regia]